MDEKSKLKIEPREKLSAPEYVIGQIKEQMLRKQIKPGDRLPSETELSALCGVSRGSVRQAMSSLETIGIVSIRPGDGTYVNSELNLKSFNPLLFSLLIMSPSEMEMAGARSALERDILELIISDEAASNRVLPLLEENVAKHQQLLKNNASIAEIVDNDCAFHMVLSSNCGNTLLAAVYSYVMDFFRLYLVETTTRQLGNDVTVGAHETILEAIRTRDYAKAKSAALDTVQLWYELMMESAR